MTAHSSLDSLSSLWVYLAASPLTWLTVTLAAYAVADAIAARFDRHPAANPVLISVALVAAALLATGTPYPKYLQGAQFVHFLLGPATVALAIPLIENLHRLRKAALPMLVALVAGSLTAAASAVAIAYLLGAGPKVVASLAPKSVTAPIAMGIAEQIGGVPALTAVLVVTTGVIGAIVATPLFNLMGIRDYAARGFATGIAAHGIGTARAFQVSELSGAFSGIAMALNGILTALLLPLAVALWF